MLSNVWRDKNLRGTNLCDLRLTRIIRINKSHAEICTFTVHGNFYQEKIFANFANTCHW